MLGIFQVPNKFFEQGGRIADVLGQDWEAAWGHAGNLKSRRLKDGMTPDERIGDVASGRRRCHRPEDPLESLGFNRALFRLPDARGPSDQPDKDLTAVVRPHGRTTWVRMLELSFWPRVSILIGLLVAGLLGLLALDPIPQSPDYHRFADTRSLFGIPNFNDVASNAGFAVVGILGILVVSGKRSRVVFAERSDAWPYLAFFIGVALVSAGSAYYHWAPSNDRLLWDRLPMSIAFMAFCSAIIADRIDAKAGNVWLLPMLIGLGLVSLVYWNWTESAGAGRSQVLRLRAVLPDDRDPSHLLAVS